MGYKRYQTDDGILLSVEGIGSINIKPLGILHYVFHVPRLFMNLASVQRIAKLDEYRIIFDDFDVFLYNKVHGWRTGLAKVHNGLYYIHNTHVDTVKEVEDKVTVVTTNSVAKKIHWLHKRLGHPSLLL